MRAQYTQNDRYDELFIELIGDRLMPHPSIAGEVICLPQGMQLKWTHKVSDTSCGSCGVGMLLHTYYANAIVKECEDERLPVMIAIKGDWIVETSEKRYPIVCTLYDVDRRGVLVNTLLPPHLRENYKW